MIAPLKCLLRGEDLERCETSCHIGDLPHRRGDAEIET